MTGYICIIDLKMQGKWSISARYGLIRGGDVSLIWRMAWRACLRKPMHTFFPFHAYSMHTIITIYAYDMTQGVD